MVVITPSQAQWQCFIVLLDDRPAAASHYAALSLHDLFRFDFASVDAHVDALHVDAHHVDAHVSAPHGTGFCSPCFGLLDT